MSEDREQACAACGMVNPPGGLRLGPEDGGAEYEWFCRQSVACVERIAVERPFTAICVKCGCKLRKTKYPSPTPDRYWFDEQGLAGCSLGGFHAGRTSDESKGV